jgi:hypothetical protein
VISISLEGSFRSACTKSLIVIKKKKYIPLSTSDKDTISIGKKGGGGASPEGLAEIVIATPISCSSCFSSLLFFCDVNFCSLIDTDFLNRLEKFFSS